MLSFNKLAANRQLGVVRTHFPAFSTICRFPMTNENLGPHGEFPHQHEVRLTRMLPAPIEQVWAFLTDADKRSTWLAVGHMDVHLHGHLKLDFDNAALSPEEPVPEKYEENGTRFSFETEITRCEPPNALGFNWHGGSDVLFELTSLPDETRLVLTHRNLASTEETIDVAAGWHVHLAYLFARLTDQKPPLFWANHARLHEEYAARFAEALPV
jgi:uncharacterized protein YndB with AHSA1/START domain